MNKDDKKKYISYTHNPIQLFNKMHVFGKERVSTERISSMPNLKNSSSTISKWLGTEQGYFRYFTYSILTIYLT